MERPPFRSRCFETYNIYPVIFKFFPHLLEDLRNAYLNDSELRMDSRAFNLDRLFYWSDTSQGHEFWNEEHEAYCLLRRKEEL